MPSDPDEDDDLIPGADSATRPPRLADGETEEELVGDDPELLGDALAAALGLEDGEETVGLDDAPADVESPESCLDAFDETDSVRGVAAATETMDSENEDPSEFVSIDDDEYGWTLDTHATGFGDEDDDSAFDVDLDAVPTLGDGEAFGVMEDEGTRPGLDYDDALPMSVPELPSIHGVTESADSLHGEGPDEPDIELPPLPPLGPDAEAVEGDLEDPAP